MKKFKTQNKHGSGYSHEIIKSNQQIVIADLTHKLSSNMNFSEQFVKPSAPLTFFCYFVNIKVSEGGVNYTLRYTMCNKSLFNS